MQLASKRSATVLAVEHLYQTACKIPSDINEHLPTLRKYGEQCNTIVEFGLRSGISTIAWIAAAPKYLYTYDLNPVCRATWTRLRPYADMNGIEFEFRNEDSGRCKMPKTDLLFLDTLHTDKQIRKELEHARRVKKYIIIHDTQIFGVRGEGGGLGISYAIREFVETKPWKVQDIFTHNNGLTILRRLENNG